MTPAEFAVLLDSRAEQFRRTIDVMDSLNALNCQVTLGSSEVKMNDLRLFPSDTIEEQPTGDTISVFKQWVTVTGGETI
jgi:hypothetical protein